MVGALAVIGVIAYSVKTLTQFPDLNELVALEQRIEIFTVRIELICFMSVVFSSMLFLFLTSLNHSTSFVLSEFDIYKVKFSYDLFKTDVLDLRFREMNMFNGHCVPAFVTAIVVYTTQL